MDSGINSVEYVNLDDAVTRVGGNASLYKRLLGRFLDGKHFEVLELALKNGNMEDAIHQAHSLKGVSANLSLAKVSSTAAKLEQLLKNEDNYSSCLEELKQAVAITTEIISEILDSAQ